MAAAAAEVAVEAAEVAEAAERAVGAEAPKKTSLPQVTKAVSRLCLRRRRSGREENQRRGLPGRRCVDQALQIRIR